MITTAIACHGITKVDHCGADFAARLTQYGDWGNPCATALGTTLWPAHLRGCERCRTVQARWDRPAAARALWERVHPEEASA